ncbi:hypothetical protein, partial [Pseudoflavonifractor phocaeensis]|uniref:hypothetical protein n=1 Tax=Pseudoflavonifractor phocaeensis TaxID=1870988 RepID=UPI00210CB7F7
VAVMRSQAAPPAPPGGGPFSPQFHAARLRGDAYKNKKATPTFMVWDLSAVARKLPLADDNALVRAKNQFVDIRAVDVLKIHTLYLLSSVVLLLYLIFQEKQEDICLLCINFL